MAMAAEKSALERRWVQFSELPLSQIHCDPTGRDCEVDDKELPHPITGSWTMDAFLLINPKGKGAVQALAKQQEDVLAN